jgi:hypothetical protein
MSRAERAPHPSARVTVRSHSGMLLPDTPGEKATVDSGGAGIERAASLPEGWLRGSEQIALPKWRKARLQAGWPVVLLERVHSQDLATGKLHANPEFPLKCIPASFADASPFRQPFSSLLDRRFERPDSLGTGPGAFDRRTGRRRGRLRRGRRRQQDADE